MEKAPDNSELTSTLHLGLRSVVSPESAFTSFLSSLSISERSAIDEVLKGGPEKAMIVVHRGASKGARFLIAQDRSSIGRSPESEIFLDDVTVSRSHAVIERTATSFTLNDLGSLNGTYINNQSLKSTALVCGDEIQIGKFHLIFISAQSK
ncbi:Forkhead-associated (FHA) domain [Candidatus Nanopelagicaceae bacterium]